MTRQLRIGYAQALGLGVHAAKEYLAYAIRQTVNECRGEEWSQRGTINYTEQQIPEKLNQASVIFAADAGKPVGCIMFGLWKEKAPWLPDVNNDEILYIDALYVAPEYRRLGIAKLLLRMAMRQHTSSTGAVCLHTNDGNEKALSLYQRLGFKYVSFERAYSRPINTVKEIRAKLKKIKAGFGKHKVTSKNIDILDDEFIIMQLQRHGLQAVFGGQHIFSFEEDEALPKGMKWRRRYYGMKYGNPHHLLSRTMPLLNKLAKYVNYGIYLDGKIVGLYSLLEPREAIRYLCIFPTDDKTAANLARFALYDAMIQLLPSRKENCTTGSHDIVFRPAFPFGYLCLTQKEGDFWKNEGFTTDFLLLLGNRAHIDRETSLPLDQLEALPADLRLCHAVASGQHPKMLPPQMSADDWLYLIASLQRTGSLYMERVCKDFSAFSKNSLVALFAASEIDKNVLFANVNSEDLTVEDWAKITWVGKECIPMCPEKIWRQFTPSLWDKIMANNTIKEWHFGSLEEWEQRSCPDDVKTFIAEHPDFVDKYPLGSVYRYQVQPLERLGLSECDKDGVEYPELLKMHNTSNEDVWLLFTDDDEDSADEDEDEYEFN